LSVTSQTIKLLIWSFYSYECCVY